MIFGGSRISPLRHHHRRLPDHRHHRHRHGPLAAAADRAAHHRALGPGDRRDARRHSRERSAAEHPASRDLSRLPLFGPEGRKIIAGVVLIVLVLFGQQLYGRATAAGRLDPALRDATGPRNVDRGARLHARPLPQRARAPSTACSPAATARSTASACATSAPTTSPASPPSPGSRASSRCREDVASRAGLPPCNPHHAGRVSARRTPRTPRFLCQEGGGLGETSPNGVRGSAPLA